MQAMMTFVTWFIEKFPEFLMEETIQQVEVLEPQLTYQNNSNYYYHSIEIEQD